MARGRVRRTVRVMVDTPVVAGYSGLDSSDAVQLGALLARTLRQPLVVASAYHYEPAALSARATEMPENKHRLDAAEARVEQARNLVPPGVEIRERVVPADDVAEALVDLAREVDACAIVVGRDLDGDVTRAILAHAPCPVAISPFNAPVPGEAPLRTIGVAYDASPAARLALTAAMHLAGLSAARVLVLSVEVALAGAQAQADVEAAAFSQVAVEIVRLEGDPGARLIEASDELDLLVCGTRGRGRMLAAVLGSVSGHLVQASHCPVLVIPPGVRAHAAASLALTTAAR